MFSDSESELNKTSSTHTSVPSYMKDEEHSYSTKRSLSPEKETATRFQEKFKEGFVGRRGEKIENGAMLVDDKPV